MRTRKTESRITRNYLDSRQYPDWEEYTPLTELTTKVTPKAGFELHVPTPASDTQAANKKFVEDSIAAIPSAASDTEATPDTLAMRDANGCTEVADALDDDDAVNLRTSKAVSLKMSVPTAITVYATSGSKTWTKPASHTWAILVIGGGGGAGGRGNNLLDKGGGGGGSGGIATLAFDVTNETSLSFVVGAAGADSTVYGVTANSGNVGTDTDPGTGGTVAGTPTKGTLLQGVTGKTGGSGYDGAFGATVAGGGGASASENGSAGVGTTGGAGGASANVMAFVPLPSAYRSTSFNAGGVGAMSTPVAGTLGGGGGGGGVISGSTEYAGANGGTGFAVMLSGY